MRERERETIMPNTDTTPLNQTVSEEMDMFVSIGKIPANAQVTVADTGWTEEEIERMRARGYDGIDMISAWYS